ncbi:tRNA preQ1(34) S-adenosylmethionine ribosyltransferase-isomerase QueA [Marispirochaeta aestuarii]|uniref:tRNA preQ1(34) S-adenosylmethionine ribosyltransferase-isomerase QueA n=1 Tax=Marispirochaeta aestuarii TaxID=1963862 RepID=UPI0029C6AB3E|nr:tRNA preQ1(34) S-adenosylmethionine ribosyltransferase-isomerase QueA [Marispirochaeta aestuarii]
MLTRDFSFDLPEHLIAQFPPEHRGESRLLLLDRKTGTSSDHIMAEFPELLPENSLVVFNNTRVRKSRIFGRTENGGSVEFLLLKEREPGLWDAVVQRRKRQKIGRRYSFPEGVEAVLVDKPGDRGILRFDPPLDKAYLERNGAIPLPPYIRRSADESDSERYQTVYSREEGSVAAPTAGLHFTPAILHRIRERAEIRYVTLHVGIGTFAPIRTEHLSDHRMHTEEYEVSVETADAVNRARREKRPVVAVGTTTVRTLESAFSEGKLAAGRNSTDLFISPGYRFKIVDHMFTNFHTPGSSLLVMVSAFAGREVILEAYAEAVRKEYRFFSYGDAMFIQ